MTVDRTISFRMERMASLRVLNWDKPCAGVFAGIIGVRDANGQDWYILLKGDIKIQTLGLLCTHFNKKLLFSKEQAALIILAICCEMTCSFGGRKEPSVKF